MINFHVGFENSFVSVSERLTEVLLFSDANRELSEAFGVSEVDGGPSFFLVDTCVGVISLILKPNDHSRADNLLWTTLAWLNERV